MSNGLRHNRLLCAGSLTSNNALVNSAGLRVTYTPQKLRQTHRGHLITYYEWPEPRGMFYVLIKKSAVCHDDLALFATLPLREVTCSPRVPSGSAPFRSRKSCQGVVSENTALLYFLHSISGFSGTATQTPQSKSVVQVWDLRGLICARVCLCEGESY